MLRLLERKRRSRVITLIDRQRSSFFGLPLGGYIDIEEAEEVLRAIRLTPPRMPIDLVVHTPGGLQLAVEQIALALLNHRGKVTVFVPHFALSGGTMLALAADEIVMDQNAVLGRLDPQLFGFPAVSLNQIDKRKKIDRIDDRTIAVIDIAGKAIRQTEEFVKKILAENDYQKESERILKSLVSGRGTHDQPVTYKEAKDLGLRVSRWVPSEIYGLLRLYQPRRRSTSVNYVPASYR